jgi:hypothetical protein
VLRAAHKNRIKVGKRIRKKKHKRTSRKEVPTTRAGRRKRRGRERRKR